MYIRKQTEILEMPDFSDEIKSISDQSHITCFLSSFPLRQCIPAVSSAINRIKPVTGKALLPYFKNMARTLNLYLIYT